MLLLWRILTIIIITCYIYYIFCTDFQNVQGQNGVTIALILARGGSKGIKLKNLAKINNITLLAATISTIKQTKKFSEVWVSTDNDKIKREGEKYGASIHIREAYTATDDASSLVAVTEFLHHHPEVDIMALVQVTSPFLKAERLAHAVDMMSSGKYNSVFSVTRQHKLRWVNHSGYFEADNFDAYNRPRRQDWDGELIENGMFYLSRASLVMKWKMLQPPRVGVIEIPKEDSLEIDTENDLKFARMLKEIKI